MICKYHIRLGQECWWVVRVRSTEQAPRVLESNQRGEVKAVTIGGAEEARLGCSTEQDGGNGEEGEDCLIDCIKTSFGVKGNFIGSNSDRIEEVHIYFAHFDR